MPVLSLPRGAMAYDVAGTGTTALLFIHGYSCTALDWRLQVEGLSPSHTCISMDLRGHGRSGPATGELTMAAFAADAIALPMDVRRRRSARRLRWQPSATR